MTREDIENVPPEIEMLARMWIVCDPNRSVAADDLCTLFVEGNEEEHPRWKWFIPRATASAEYFAQKGFALTPTQQGE